ncbi:Uncharacterised protein [Klebsiella pneumoniae]|nr:Uncharacterised protein [Klebsiella pneumoniae]
MLIAYKIRELTQTDINIKINETCEDSVKHLLNTPLFMTPPLITIFIIIKQCFYMCNFLHILLIYKA